MADRFWVTGGTGNWNDTSNWSATSGGASGASVPGSSDAAILNASSGSGTVTLDISPDIQTLTCTGFTGTLAFGTNTISLNSTGTIFTGATTMTVTGTPLIICTNSSATARTIIPTAVTEANSISFRVTAGTGTFTISTTPTVRDLDFTDGVNPTGFAGSLTMAITTIYGNFKASTGMTCPASSNTITFAATSGTKTIDTAGVTFDRPFTFNGIGGTFQLVSALTSGATRTCTLTNGTLNLNGFTLTTGLFTTNASNATTLAFGVGNITLSGTGTIFTGSTTCTATGTPQVICTNSSATARTISPGIVTEANSISFRVTAGTGTFSISASNAVRDYDFTDGVNPTGFSGAMASNSATVYGSFKASTGMTRTAGAQGLTFAATSGTKTINTAGVTFDCPFAFNGVGGTFQLASALTSGATRSCTLTNGTLDLNGYTATFGSVSSSNSNVRTLAFGTGKIVLTGTSGTIFTTSTSTNLTVTGTNPLIQATAGGAGTRTITMGAAGESNAISVDVTAGSDQINLSTTSGAYKNISAVGFTGNLNFSSSIAVFGNFDVGTATALTGTGSPNFAATSGTKTLQSNGLAFPVNIQFSGTGGAWSLQDALSVTGTLTMTNGTLQLKSGATSTVGAFATSGTNPKYLQSTTPGSQATISDPSGTITATYLSIQDIVATGGATWNANGPTNSNISNNSGWNFSSAIGFGWGLGGWGDGEWGYGDGTFASGYVGNVSPTVSIALTGVNASGQAGTVAPSRTKALTGVTASGAVGSVTETNSPTENGNVAVGSVGTVVPSRSVALTGVSASGSVGTVAPSRTVALTSVFAAGSVGTVVQSKAVALTGNSASGAVGTVTLGARSKALTGNAASGAVGSVTQGISKALTGVSATGSVGTVVQSASAPLTGVFAQGSVSQVIVPLNPLTATGSVGTVVQEVSIALSGVNASGSVGTMSVAARVLALTGVNARGSVGDVIAVYWKPIDDTQTPSWQNISNPQTPGWGDVSDEQTPAWEEVVT
jgi:hypothetical protein